MTDTKEQSGGAVKRPAKRTLSLKRTVETGHVKQSFSHGRTKQVVVEKKKKRVIVPPGSRGKAGVTAKSQEVGTAAKKPTEAPLPGGLSPEERDARARALALAREREKQEAEARRRAEEEARRRAEEEAKRKAEEEARRRAEEEARAKEREEEAARQEKAAATETHEAPAAKTKSSVEETETAKTTEASQAAEVTPPPAPQSSAAQKPRKETVKPQPPKKAERQPEKTEGRPKPRRVAERRIKGKLTIHNFDADGRERSLAQLRRQQQRQKRQMEGPREPQKKVTREVILPEFITIQELANRMAERAVDIIKFLMKQGQMHKINDIIDADTAEIIVDEFGHKAKRVSEADVEEGLIGEEDPEELLKPRPPVVTVMGHVDHGKTSLLDAIRHTNTVSGEAGGITQHIGAYQVELDSGERITFIDTPGHAAFTQMRARGAKVTDIVVLVVAADDGVMPQTIEAINHAKAADVPIIVAINKIDKPDADPDRVRTELLQHEVIVESLSGDVLDVEVSALTGEGLDKLLEAIILQAEILELKANPDRKAEGVVIEAKLERGRGTVATVLVQRGTLKMGNIMVAGIAWGKVRALLDDRGKHVTSAGPSQPVEVLGLNAAPDAGDTFAVVESEARAREITEYRERKRRQALAAGAGPRASLEQMMSQLAESGRKEFPLIIKADVQGSVEAIVGAVEKLGNDEVRARVVHAAVGGINESDVTLAEAAKAVILAFNVRANKQARDLAEREGIEIRYYSVIYDLVDDVKAAMSGLLSPELRETHLGNAEILEVFNISKVGKVAGCRVTEGKVERGAKVRLIRDNVVIHEGELATLKRYKDEVKEVQAGQECGMAFANYQDIRQGDIIECFRVEEVQRTL